MTQSLTCPYLEVYIPWIHLGQFFRTLTGNLFQKPDLAAMGWGRELESITTTFLIPCDSRASYAKKYSNVVLTSEYLLSRSSFHSLHDIEDVDMILLPSSGGRGGIPSA